MYFLVERISAIMVSNAVLLMLVSSVFSYLGIALIVFYLLPHMYFINVLYNAVPYFLILLGLGTLSVNLYGTCAVTSQNKKHLWFYSVLMFVVLCAHLTGILLVNELRITAQSKIFATADIHQFAQDYQSLSSVQKSWDSIQSFYVCCGGYDPQTGYEIWRDVLGGSVPDSCCLTESPQCGDNVFNVYNRHNIHTRIATRGCMFTVEQAIIRDVCPLLFSYVICDAILCLFIMLGILLSCFAASHIHMYGYPCQEYDKYNDYFPEEGKWQMTENTSTHCQPDYYAHGMPCEESKVLRTNSSGTL